MATSATSGRGTSSSRSTANATAEQVANVLDWLERRGTQANREGMARFGIRPTKVYGVSMTTMRPLVKRLGKDHQLALALWETGWHEARLLASFVAEPSRVTSALMEAWVRDFDSWAVCDSVCLHLFDRTPYAFAKARVWSRRRDELVKRAAFALLAGLAVHDKQAADAAFLAHFPDIERAASDPRNFVKKAVNWALRQIGKRNLALNAEAVDLALGLSQASGAAERWVGKDALRELTSAAVRQKLARRAGSAVQQRRKPL